MSNLSTWKIHVTGKVQGVFFRASTEEKARALGINGWVRNQSDGSVRIIAQGTKSNLNALLEWLNHGPERADVDYVKWEETQGSQVYEEFKIKR